VSEARRPDAIAREIRADILGGRYRPGERLPSERELAERVGANRGSAREALRILAQQRLIEIRPGGARVNPVHQARLDVLADMLQSSSGPDAALMAQLLDVHELLLCGAVRLAVERGTESELARAIALLDTMSDETREGEYLRTMTELIALIAEASRNLVLRMVGNSLLGILATVVPVLRRLRPPRASLAPAIACVREALVERDPAAAEQAIRSLLRIQREYVLKQLDLAAAPRSLR
jgi:GntR family transcriptional repressor for pyruvate dehydrogenase complex